MSTSQEPQTFGELSPWEQRLIVLWRNRQDLAYALADSMLVCIHSGEISEQKALRLFRILFDDPARFATEEPQRQDERPQ